MTQQLLLSVLVFAGLFAGMFILFGSKVFDSKGSNRTKTYVHDYARQHEIIIKADEDTKKKGFKGESAFGRSISHLPFIGNVPYLLTKTGMKLNMPIYFMMTAFFLVLFNAVSNYFSFGIYGFFAAIYFGITVPKKVILSLVEKRIEKFIERFPDAIDMIVRSVKSGHPLNSALKMIAENSEEPIAGEFRQIVDEVSYGRTLSEALYKMVDRVDQVDVSFFVVVLAVQQETGGNLAEVLSNLSNVIRKRKQLRQKIKALTSEGRMTGWILGSLPFVLMLVLSIVSPGYLDPIFQPGLGKIILGFAMGLIVIAIVIMKKLIKIDI